MRPGKHALDKNKCIDALIDHVERIEAGIRVKFKHPFRVVERQFGFAGSV